MITKLVMWWLHKQYNKKEYGDGETLHIIGTGSDYPKYLLYTEDENTYQRMENF